MASGNRILRTASWTQPSNVYHLAPLIPFGVEDTQMPYAFIRVYKTSLIFVDVDIQLSPQSNFDQISIGSDSAENLAAASVQTTGVINTESLAPLENYFLSEKRRLKFKEIHYFDHPKIGAILGVWPAS